MKNKTTFSLKEMRQRNKLSAKQVADRFDVHVNTIYNWERHLAAVPIGTLIDLLNLYDFRWTDIDLSDIQTENESYHTRIWKNKAI